MNENNGSEDIYYRYITYSRYNPQYQEFTNVPLWQNHEEQQYLDCLHNIITTGIETQDRTSCRYIFVICSKIHI